MEQSRLKETVSPNRYALVGAVVGGTFGILVASFQDYLLNWTLVFFLVSVPLFLSFMITGHLQASPLIAGVINVLYLAPIGYLFGKLIVARVRRTYLLLAVGGIVLLHTLFLYLDAQLISKALVDAIQRFGR
jgi:hypothetical protein